MTCCFHSLGIRVPRRRSECALLAAAWVLLSCASFVSGQSTLGTIVGRLSDPSGAPLAGANVTVRNEATNVTSTVQQTSAQGEYVFANVEPGMYELSFDAKGFAPYRVQHLALEVSQTVRQDLTLQLGTVASTVQVTADRTLVQTDTSSVGSVIESNQIRRMPLNGRTNMFGLLALSPGVQRPGTNPRIGGSSYIGIQATMDGALNMEMENTRLSSADPSLESLGEFRVINSTGSAEYGGGTAQVIASTKSGTNAFHGSLFEYNRNRVTAAKNFFATGLPKAPYNRNEFGGSLGGPIKHDKLFFFGSYEALTFRSSTTNLTAQPTTALAERRFHWFGDNQRSNDAAAFPRQQDPFQPHQLLLNGTLPLLQYTQSGNHGCCRTWNELRHKSPGAAA